MTYRGHMQNGVAVLDAPANLPDGTPVRIEVERVESPFWQNKSIAELLEDRAPSSAHTLEDLAGDWPEEDSIDQFLAFIRPAIARAPMAR